MSHGRPYSRDSLERALVHHEVEYTRPTDSRRGATWWIQVDLGRETTDHEVYCFLAGFKMARDRWEFATPTTEGT